LQKDAAAKAGVTAEYVSKALKKPSVRAFYARCAAESIAGAVPKAAATLLRLLDAKSEHVQHEVAIDILQTPGVVIRNGKDVLVNVENNLSPGYTIIIPASAGREEQIIDGQTGAIEAVE
jgi:hypothetical protein